MASNYRMKPRAAQTLWRSHFPLTTPFIELFDGLLMLYGVEDEEAETVAWVS